jgi:hypothetical protein
MLVEAFAVSGDKKRGMRFEHFVSAPKSGANFLI